MSDIAKSLSEATVDQLVEELLKRPGVVPSVWSADDVRSMVEEDESAADLSDEQVDAVCGEFLSRAAKGLSGHLGEQGNHYLLHFWEREGADILKDVAAAKPSI